MKDRLKILRDSLNLNQEEFAVRLNLSKTSISLYETGIRFPTDRVICDICREYHVNECWLRSGEGDMLEDTSSILDAIEEIAHLDAIDKEFILCYLNLNPERRQVLKDFFLDLAKRIENKTDDI